MRGWITRRSEFSVCAGPSPQGPQVAVAVDGVAGQVEACQLGRACGERLQDAELVVAEVQVGQARGFGYGCVGQVLQGHVVQEEVGELGHGHRLLPQVGHGIVAQIQAGHLWQSGGSEEM